MARAVRDKRPCKKRAFLHFINVAVCAGRRDPISFFLYSARVMVDGKCKTRKSALSIKVRDISKEFCQNKKYCDYNMHRKIEI